MKRNIENSLRYYINEFSFRSIYGTKRDSYITDDLLKWQKEKYILTSESDLNKSVIKKFKNINKHLKEIADYLLSFETDVYLDFVKSVIDKEKTLCKKSNKPITKDNSKWGVKIGSKNSNKNKVRVPRKKASKTVWLNFYKLFPEVFENLDKQYQPIFYKEILK